MCVAVVCLLLVSGATATANAATIYSGTISSSMVDIAEKIPLSFSDEYVFYRSGQYEYTLVASPDLEYEKAVFSFNTSGQVYVITTSSGVGTNYYTYETYSTDNFYLNPDDLLVYSSIGGFPTLTERGANYEAITFFVVCVACMCAVVRSIFSFVLRRRG